MSFVYDGFGNRLDQNVSQGSGPAMSLTFDGSTNWISTPGYGYDANGNMTAMPGKSMTYDYANRLKWVLVNSAPVEYYGYAPDNKRIYKKSPNGSGGWKEEMYFYVGNQKLLTVTPRMESAVLTAFDTLQTHLWFGARKLAGRDRLGSDMTSQKRFYPYGEEASSTANDADKFATYYRDQQSGFDYADQRYYCSITGRFLTADSIDGKPCNPQSLNQYAYAQSDPVNFNDPEGTLPASVTFDGTVGCVQTGFVAPGGTVDASSPCPPGFSVAYGGFSAPKSRLQQVFEAFDPLSGVIDDWEYANQSGTSFNITLSVDRFAQGFLPQLAGAGAAGGVILIAGAPVTWTVTVTGAIVLGGVALWQTGILQNLLKGKPTPREEECKKVKQRCIEACSDSTLPTRDHGFSFWNCLNKCMQDAGCL